MHTTLWKTCATGNAFVNGKTRTRPTTVLQTLKQASLRVLDLGLATSETVLDYYSIYQGHSAVHRLVSNMVSRLTDRRCDAMNVIVDT